MVWSRRCACLSDDCKSRVVHHLQKSREPLPVCSCSVSVFRLRSTGIYWFSLEATSGFVTVFWAARFDSENLNSRLSWRLLDSSHYFLREGEILDLLGDDIWNMFIYSATIWTPYRQQDNCNKHGFRHPFAGRRSQTNSRTSSLPAGQKQAICQTKAESSVYLNDLRNRLHPRSGH